MMKKNIIFSTVYFLQKRKKNVTQIQKKNNIYAVYEAVSVKKY